MAIFEVRKWGHLCGLTNGQLTIIISRFLTETTTTTTTLPADALFATKPMARDRKLRLLMQAGRNLSCVYDIVCGSDFEGQPEQLLRQIHSKQHTEHNRQCQWGSACILRHRAMCFVCLHDVWRACVLKHAPATYNRQMANNIVSGHV